MQALHYKDITLVPKFSSLKSRTEAITSVKLGKFIFKAPVVPANMKCSIDVETARNLDQNSFFYIMHRFDIDAVEFVKMANDEKWNCISISVGVNKQDYELLNEIYNRGYRVDFITVDIAHGHCLLMKEMLEYLKIFHNKGTTIIAGNIATKDAAYDLIKWGADIVKVGIGQGYVCTTKDKTGFTMPMFSCVNKMPVHIPVIADGGIRCHGDITKALVAGATMVMCGSLFARLIDSPSAVFKDQHTGETLKEYYGSASFYNKGIAKNIEGRHELMTADHMTYLEKLNEIIEDLQSSVSYAGGTNLDDLKRVEYFIQNI